MVRAARRECSRESSVMRKACSEEPRLAVTLRFALGVVVVSLVTGIVCEMRATAAANSKCPYVFSKRHGRRQKVGCPAPAS